MFEFKLLFVFVRWKW